MKHKVLSILFLPLLTACPEETKSLESAQVPCFDIILTGANTPPPSPILLNKCTGETWMVLHSDVNLGDKEKGRSYSWYKMERYAVENVAAK